MPYYRKKIIEWIETDKDEPVEEVISDEAIIQSLLNPSIPKEVDSDDDKEETNTTPTTWQEAADALNTFIKFTEHNSLYNDAEIMNLHILRNEFFRKRTESRKQTDIRDLFKRASSKI